MVDSIYSPGDVLPATPAREDPPRRSGASGATLRSWRRTAGALPEVAERADPTLALPRPLLDDLTARLAPSGGALAFVDARGVVLWSSGLDLPPAVTATVATLLERARATAHDELVVDWTGALAGVRLHASLVRHDATTLGAVVRLAPTSARRPGRGTVAMTARYGFADVLGDSPMLKHAVAMGRMAARNDLPVVLVGESGTGKELFAQAIHGASGRGDGPFVAVNCGCIPASLVEAELFGYEAGTFTGGRKDGNAGKFEEASGGTFFLDEVSELPMQAQTALLRVLQEREVVRLGGSSPRGVDIRVIAAGSESLADEVKAGRFRPDLYFRLNVLTIALPPLRERRSDVGLLAEAFLREAEVELGRQRLTVDDEAQRALASYDWPGNVRELRNAVLRAAVTAPGAAIELADLPAEIRADFARVARRARVPVIVPGQDPDREALLQALEACAWNVARTAHSLQVSRMTLYRWLRKHRIER